jgi:replicative DNA helicase
MSKINYWDKLQEQIDRGKRGLNTGIPFYGFTTLSDQIDNIQQGRYDLIFAGTGIGKSAFVDSTYIYGAIDFLQAHPNYIHDLEIIYYSLEIPPEDQIAKHIARLIWEEHGILTTVKEIKSRGNLTIRPEVEKLIDSYKEKMDEIQKKYIHFRTSLNPDFLYKDIMGYAEKRGTIYKNVEGQIVKYIPNNPGLITLIVIDHMGLMDLGKYNTLKEAIDQTSKYLVKFRNWFNFSPLPIFQMNRSSEGMDRRKDDDWEPQLSDIKNSGGPSEDANTVIGLASPYNYKVDNYRGYDITKYKDRFRMGKICKNRDGSPNIVANFLFIGEIGRYYQLPKAIELGNSPPEELKKVNDYYKSLNNKL